MALWLSTLEESKTLLVLANLILFSYSRPTFNLSKVWETLEAKLSSKYIESVLG